LYKCSVPGKGADPNDPKKREPETAKEISKIQNIEPKMENAGKIGQLPTDKSVGL
jgi:hypothetical protein